MGSVFPPLNNNTSCRKITAWEKLNSLKDTLVFLKDYSKGLAASFVITPSDLDKLEKTFYACQTLSNDMEEHHFAEAEAERLRQDCLNCFAVFEAGFAPCAESAVAFSE